MAGTCYIDEVPVERLKLRQQSPRPRWTAAAWIAVTVCAVVIAGWVLVSMAHGVIDEYRGMTERLAAAERQNALLAEQVALLDRGQCGIALANIQTDFGPASLRLVPSRGVVR